MSLAQLQWRRRSTAKCPSSYLVDPASSHMLVSKIKPCMSKYKLVPSETADGSLNQLWFLGTELPTWITVVILELIHANKRRPSGRRAFIRNKANAGLPAPLGELWITLLIARSSTGDGSFKCLPYQLSMVRYAPTMVVTGNGESGFDSGEGA